MLYSMIILAISIFTFWIYPNIINILIIQSKYISLSSQTILSSTRCSSSSSRSFCCCMISTTTCSKILLVLTSDNSILLLKYHFFVRGRCVILIYIYCIKIITFLYSWYYTTVHSIYCVHLWWILWYWSSLN